MASQHDTLVMVTGSSGLIGSAVCRRLEEAGYRTFGLDRPGLPHPPEVSEAVDFDVTQQASIDAAMATVRRDGGERIASVIHLAAYYDFSGEPSDLYEKVTVRGTQRLLRAVRENFQAVEQFVFSSTMLVHAPCRPGQRINEDWPLDAKWDYPKSKLDTERLLRVERGDVPVVLLRIAGVYDDDCTSIPIAHQIQRIYERRLTSKVFPGDTSTGQAFVHLDDVMDAVRHVVDRRRDLSPESVFLIGEGEALSYDETQRMLGWLIHQDNDWDTAQIPKAVAKAGAWVQDKIPGIEEPFIKPWMIDLADDHYQLDVSRARKMLGWQPQRTLRETLSKMVESLKADPAGFYRRNKLEGAPPLPAEPAAAPAPRSH
jgi:nucleoside-diphosphate-sugar epimerase